MKIEIRNDIGKTIFVSVSKSIKSGIIYVHLASDREQLGHVNSVRLDPYDISLVEVDERIEGIDGEG